MTRTQTCEANATHFQNDSAWVKHNLMLSRMREADMKPAGLVPGVAKLESFEVIGRAA